MTDNQTPPVEPKASEQLASFWNSLSKNAKIAIGVVALVLIFVLAGSGGGSSTPAPTTVTIDTTPTTISVSEAYINWKSGFTPLIAQVQSDYTTTYADLSNSDQASATSDFAKLSQDATDLYAMANSPDEILNGHVRDLASAIQDIATTGIYALNNPNGDLTEFANAVAQMNTATNNCTADLQRDNAQY